MNGWGPQSTYNKTYESGKEATISGKILGIDTNRKPQNSMLPATTITVLQHNGKVAEVHLGPTWYMRNIRSHVAVGNTVKVTGSQVDLNGDHVLLARKLIEGNRVLYLRDLSGYPFWVATHTMTATIAPASGTPHANNGVPGTILDANGSSIGDSPFGPVALTVYPPPPATPPTNGTAPAAGTTPAANAVANQAQTFGGTLQNVVHAVNPQTGVSETFMLVNTPQGTMSVDLGPDWFVSQQGMNFDNGSHILVNGVPVNANTIQYGPAGPAYLANGVNFGGLNQNQVMILRNGGIPVWDPWFPNR